VKSGPTYDDWLKNKNEIRRVSTATSMASDIQKFREMHQSRRSSVSKTGKEAPTYQEWVEKKKMSRRNSVLPKIDAEPDETQNMPKTVRRGSSLGKIQMTHQGKLFSCLF
jgi:hypothetical protein